ncbi:AHH domain-containing protein [Vibrio diabolicus]|uniref:AHH domain-containing protein n=2 Tax=Vibrio TaxID=662 RepID=UPI002658ADCD|nr:AHH domain-containing protein [Vibrio diabolicus]
MMKTNLSTAGYKSNRPSEPTAAELALDRFETLVTDFYEKYRKKPSVVQSKEQKERLLQAEAEDLAFLKKKRIQLIAHAKAEELQLKLAAYTASNNTKTANELAAEKHHPTRMLANNLTAAGEPKPTRRHEPHHIIPGKGQYKLTDMRRIRLNLHMHKIGINAAENGVWLMNFAKNIDLNWESPNSPAHRSIHTSNYETWISTRFAAFETKMHVFKANLLQVKMNLKNGTHPPEILQSIDKNWKGV